MRLFRSISIFSSVFPIRKYSIVEPQLKGRADFKPVLLTFDDGPNHIDEVTMNLLTVLKKHNVKACFCLIGDNVRQHPHIVKQMYLDGHILANHGNTGDVFIFKNMKKLPQDIEDCNIAIAEAIEDANHQINYFRPGYGAYLQKHNTLWKSKNMHLLPVTDFFFDHKVKSNGMEKLVLQFTKKVKKNNGGVYVLHDGRNTHHKIREKVTAARFRNMTSDYDRGWIPEAVDKILTELKATGFILPALNDEFPNQLHPDFRAFLFPE
jgi:peptidoglycan/xylan/chitin deacetylase (PgdA/CDA1 family)